MSSIIEFCRSNYANGTGKVMNELLEDPGLDADILEYGCLGNCGQCFLEPFAMVNGEIVSADTPDELLSAIYEAVKKKELEDEEWRKLGF